MSLLLLIWYIMVREISFINGLKVFFDNEHGARENADLMLLYLIIKCKVRREFVQTNNLRGFVNFSRFMTMKRFSTLDTEEEKWEKSF